MSSQTHEQEMETAPSICSFLSCCSPSRAVEFQLPRVLFLFQFSDLQTLSLTLKFFFFLSPSLSLSIPSFSTTHNPSHSLSLSSDSLLLLCLSLLLSSHAYSIFASLSFDSSFHCLSHFSFLVHSSHGSFSLFPSSPFTSCTLFVPLFPRAHSLCFPFSFLHFFYFFFHFQTPLSLSYLLPLFQPVALPPLSCFTPSLSLSFSVSISLLLKLSYAFSLEFFLSLLSSLLLTLHHVSLRFLSVSGSFTSPLEFPETHTFLFPPFPPALIPEPSLKLYLTLSLQLLNQTSLLSSRSCSRLLTLASLLSSSISFFFTLLTQC